MKYLTLDTTTKATALALAEIRHSNSESHSIDTETCHLNKAGMEGYVHVIGEGFLHDHKTHSERLIPFLEALLSAAGWALDDLEGIIAVRGPGSFTGIRIGLATAQGLAKALNLPLWGLLSLDCLSWAAAHMALGRKDIPLTAVILDARKNEWYAACYAWNSPNNRLCPIPPCAATPESFLQQLNEISGTGTVIFAGDAVLKKEAQQLIQDRLGKRAIILPSEQALPRGSYVVHEFVYAQKSDKDMETAPYYLRLSEAEAKYLLKKKQQQKSMKQNHAPS